MVSGPSTDFIDIFTYFLQPGLITRFPSESKEQASPTSLDQRWPPYYMFSKCHCIFLIVLIIIHGGNTEAEEFT